MGADPQYQKGTSEPGGPSDALPQGGATAVAGTASVAPTTPPEAPTTGAEAPTEASLPEPAMPGDNEPQFQAQSEEEDFLTGPTLRPDEAQSVGIPAGSAGVPPAVVRNLPFFQRLAAEPDADPQLVTMVKLALRELGR